MRLIRCQKLYSWKNRQKRSKSRLLKFLPCMLYVMQDVISWTKNLLQHKKALLMQLKYFKLAISNLKHSMQDKIFSRGHFFIITKTRLFNYIGNFTTKKWKFSDKKFWYFSYFCTKHRLWVLVVGNRTHNLCFEQK